MDSILSSVKKALGIAEEYFAFDVDIIMHINSALAVLSQMGVGPEGGFSIENETPVWNDYLENDARLNLIKTYIYMNVRLLFDPPNTSFGINLLNEKIKEYEWRISEIREVDKWTAAN